MYFAAEHRSDARFGDLRRIEFSHTICRSDDRQEPQMRSLGASASASNGSSTGGNA
jgi:hypothetical protein